MMNDAKDTPRPPAATFEKTEAGVRGGNSGNGKAKQAAHREANELHPPAKQT